MTLELALKHLDSIIENKYHYLTKEAVEALSIIRDSVKQDNDSKDSSK